MIELDLAEDIFCIFSRTFTNDTARTKSVQNWGRSQIIDYQKCSKRSKCSESCLMVSKTCESSQSV